MKVWHTVAGLSAVAPPLAGSSLLVVVGSGRLAPAESAAP